MKKLMVSLFILLLGTAPFLVYSAASREQKPPVTVPLRFDYYYTYGMVIEALEKLHQAYPDLTTLDLVGKSEEGRSIYCMTVNNPKTGAPLSKPGIYVDGNIHGNEIQAGEVSLYLLDYLLGNYGKMKEITELVDKKCFYVVPVVNVDGRYHFFKDGNSDSSNRSLRIPKDDDHDGLVDEDFETDLDGDGNICMMRKKDPNGKYKIDPEDPRAMVKVKPGEKGEWTLLGQEGIDHDGDGKVGEDSEGYVDGNRNWSFDWQPPYAQTGSGNFPFEAIGLKALSEYIQKRPNICVAWAFHNYGGMYLRGPATKSQGEYLPQDVAVYDYLGAQSERITPGYRYLIGWKDLYATHGDFVEWMAMVNGSYGFTGELSISKAESFKTASESKKEVAESKNEGEEDEGLDLFESRDIERERERLKFNDNLAQGEMFVPWRAYKHPTYGDVEIGGWIKFSDRLPTPFMIKDMVHRNASVVIFSAKQTPEVSMEVFDKKEIGKNLYRIRVRLTNSKAIPTMSAEAVKVNLYPKDILKVSGKGVKVVNGGKIENIYKDKVNYKDHRPEIQFIVVPGFGNVEYQFLVSGSGSVEIDYSSRHAGKISKTIQLQ